MSLLNGQLKATARKAGQGAADLATSAATLVWNRAVVGIGLPVMGFLAYSYVSDITSAQDATAQDVKLLRADVAVIKEEVVEIASAFGERTAAAEKDRDQLRARIAEIEARMWSWRPYPPAGSVQ